MRYQWTPAYPTLLCTQNLTVLATSSTEATLTKAQAQARSDNSIPRSVNLLLISFFIFWFKNDTS